MAKLELCRRKWCGFSNIWKLYVAIWIGILINLFYQRKNLAESLEKTYWFLGYMTAFLGLSYLGSFEGIGLLKFPYDLLVLLPFSIVMLYLSQASLTGTDATIEEIVDNCCGSES